MRVKIRIIGLILMVGAVLLMINGKILGGNTVFIGMGIMILGIALIATVSQSKSFD